MLTTLGESPSNSAGGPGGSGGPNAPQTITVTAPGESSGNPGESQGQGTTPCTDSGSGSASQPNIVTVTGTNGGPAGGNGGSGSSPTAVTITVLGNPSEGSGGNGGNSPLPTVTVTEPANPSGGSGSGNGGGASSPFSNGGGPENPSGGPGGNGGGGASLPTITLTAPPALSTGPNGGSGGQGLTSNPAGSGEVTVTVSNPGGYGGSPSAGSGASNTGADQGSNSNAATLTDVPPAGGYGAVHPTIHESDGFPGVSGGPGGQGGGQGGEAPETLTVVSTRSDVPTRTVTVPEGETGALPTNTFTSRSPWSAVPTSGWNASASGAGSPATTSTPCPDTTENDSQMSKGPITSSSTDGWSIIESSGPTDTETNYWITGESVVCVQPTAMTVGSRTFSWCAQIETHSDQPRYHTTYTLDGYTYTHRDNAELAIPSTLSTIVVRSLGSVPSSSAASVGPAPSTCGNHADVGDFTFSVSSEASPTTCNEQ